MRVGEVVAGRFVIEAKIGAGGMGTVYRAHDRSSRQPVALKLLTAAGLENLERFEREAQTLLELSHPGIARYVAHGFEPSGLRYLVMEWLDGEPLARRLDRGPLAIDDALAIAKRIGEALGAAHARGVVHRDVKPSNVVLVRGEASRATLIDFGIARDLESELTLTGQMLGTPGYMSPEQARGQTLDARADVFALGCLLFHCLTGRLPFEADAPLAILLRLVLEDAPRASTLREGVPQVVDELLARMLARSADARPESGTAVAREIAEARRGLVRASIPPSPSGLTLGERRLTSLVLARAPNAELSSPASRRAVTLSPELRGALEHHGARLDRLVDGSTLATLDGGAARDEAIRAARCALLLRGGVGEACIAVVSGRGQADGAPPVGEIIDRGVALLGQPDATAIRLDELTAGLLESRFDVARDDYGFTLVGERAFAVGARTLLARATPFVGRDAEMETLTAILDEATRTSSARAVLVIGDAGAGKSRFRHELVHRVWTQGRAEVWFAAGDPVVAGSPLSLIASLVNGSVGASAGDLAETRGQKLAARLAGLFEGDRLRRVHEFLAALTQTPLPFAPSVELAAARDNPVLLGDQMRSAFEELLVACAARAPLLVVIDDLHGIDLPSLACIDAAMRNQPNLPWVTVGLARPEVEERFPSIRETTAITRIELAPLSRRAADVIVRHALGSVDDEVSDRIAAAADGNAFYLEELIRAERGRASGVPETVLALVEARLERLSPLARRLARAASVFGRAFSERGVAKLVSEDVELDEHLRELVDNEIIEPSQVASSSISGDRELVFRNGVVRDTAYAMLTPRDRALGHRLAGEFLETASEHDAVRLAEHFELGGVPERAALWYRRAAAASISGNDYSAAIELARRGLTCGASGETRGGLELLAAEAHRYLGEFAAAERFAEAALSKLPQGGALWCLAIGELATVAQRLGHLARLEQIAVELLDVSTREGASGAFRLAAARAVAHIYYAGLALHAVTLLDAVGPVTAEDLASAPMIAARVLTAHAMSAAVKGDIGRKLELQTEAVACFERIGDLREACGAGSNMASSYAELGQYEASEAALRRWLPVAERLGLSAHVATITTNLSLARLRQSAAAEARSLAQLAVLAQKRNGDRRMEAGALLYMALAIAAQGDVPGAIDRVREAYEAVGPHGPMRLSALSLLADLQLRTGDVRAALATIEEAERASGGHYSVDGGEVLLHVAHAQALKRTGDTERARAIVARAMSGLLERAARISREDYRKSYLNRVPEHAQLLALARELSI